MSRRTIVLTLSLVGVVCLLVACGGEQDEAASTLNKAERDSVLSESRLPGASTVKGALAASDSAQARADRANAAAGH